MHWLVCILHVLSSVLVLLAVQACTSPSEGQAANISINLKMLRAADGGIPGGTQEKVAYFRGLQMRVLWW